MPITQDDWFIGTKTYITVMNKMAHDKPIGELDVTAQPVANVMLRTLEMLNYLINCNSWHHKTLLPLDAEKLNSYIKDAIEPAIEGAVAEYRRINNLEVEEAAP